MGRFAVVRDCVAFAVISPQLVVFCYSNNPALGTHTYSAVIISEQECQLLFEGISECVSVLCGHVSIRVRCVEHSVNRQQLLRPLLCVLGSGDISQHVVHNCYHL